MKLSLFNSYIEIFTALNLGYAAFDYYRNQLQFKLFRINDLSESLDNLKSRLEGKLPEHDFSNDESTESLDNVSHQETKNGATDNASNEPLDNLTTTLLDLREKISIEEDTLNKSELREQIFFELLKPISLILSLLCISYLLLSGFQDTTEDLNYYSNYFLRLSIFVGVFSFSIFFFSFSARILENKIVLKPIESVITFAIFCLFSCREVFAFCFNNPITQIANLVWIPILLLLFFVGTRVRKIKKYAEKNITESLTNFWKLFLRNFKPILSFILLILAPLIIVYFLTDNIYMKYSIILLTPTLLYILLTLRVSYHKRKYRKLFNEMAKKHEIGLTMILDSVPS